MRYRRQSLHLSLLLIPSLALLVGGCGGGSGPAIGDTAQTITLNNPGTQTAGTTADVTVKDSSGLTVILTSSTPSVCTVAGTTLSLLSAGTCVIDANEAGNSTYAAATPVEQSFTVNPAIAANTTIYIAGFASLTSNNDVQVAEEWQLNPGTPTATTTVLSIPSGMTNTQANAMAVSGSDVYVAGYGWGSTDRSAVYWSNNGAATILPSSMTFSQANGIAVSSGNVYVAGGTWNSNGDGSAVLWVNGTATTLSPLPCGGGSVIYGANGVAVSGGNVYVAGYSECGSIEAAVYWLNNGAAIALPYPKGDVNNYADALGILASGSDVYVAGGSLMSALQFGSENNAAYWINGMPITLYLPSDSANSPANPASGQASGIALSGSDVYVVGTVFAPYNAEYWVNGGQATLLPMASGTYNSWANAVAVSTQ